jgi:ABC-2 type transport system permease protein
MLLMFVYVFGGVIQAGGARYVNYLLPGILLVTVASGVAYTSLRVFTDVSGGMFERFQSMPIARSAVLWAHVLTSLLANVISLIVVVIVALAIRFRSGVGVMAWLEVIAIIVLFTLALTWLAVIAGLTGKSVDGAGGFAYPLLVPPFLIGVRTHRGHGRPGQMVRRTPAGHRHRRHAPQPVLAAAPRQRSVDRARMVRRLGPVLGARRTQLQPQARLSQPSD